jgi:hypothetical protein
VLIWVHVSRELSDHACNVFTTDVFVAVLARPPGEREEADDDR